METNNGVTLRPEPKPETMQIQIPKQLIPINAKLPPACVQGESPPVILISRTPCRTQRPLHPAALVHFTSGLFLLSKHPIPHTHYSRLITSVSNCSSRRPAFFHTHVVFNEVRTRCGPRRLNRYGEWPNDRQIGVHVSAQKRFLSTQTHYDQPWGPPRVLRKEYWRVRWSRSKLSTHIG
jgi:hypothetical protein